MNPLALRLYRTAVDGDRAVFFTTIDADGIPLVGGVTVVCSNTGESAMVIAAAADAGLSAVGRRWPDGRRAVAIQDRRPAAEAA